MKSKRHTPGWALLLMLGCVLGVVVLFSGVACQPTGGGGGGEPPAACTTDDDCAAGEVCQDGECVAAPACETDEDCEEGQVCQDGECVTAAGECDPPCAEDEVCVDGECLPADPFAGAMAQFADNGPLHDMAAGGHVEGSGATCADCHHAEPNASGLACDSCHGAEAAYDDDLEMVVPSLKDTGHAGKPGDDTTGNTACAACHQDTTDDGLWDCSQCHVNF